jgi:hypothetical protein
MAIIDHPLHATNQLPTTPRRGPRTKYTRKHTDTLTPWRREALPGHSMINILKQHVDHLANMPTPSVRRAPLPRSAERPLVRRRSQEIRGRALTCYTTEPTNEPGETRRRSQKIRGRAPTCYTTEPTNEPGETRRRSQEIRGRAPTCYTTEPTNEPGALGSTIQRTAVSLRRLIERTALGVSYGW